MIRDGDRYRIIIEEPLDTALLEGDAEEKALAVAAFYTEANERMSAARRSMVLDAQPLEDEAGYGRLIELGGAGGLF